MSDLPDIERIQAIELGPNDYLILTLPDDTTPDQFEHFQKAITDKLTDMLGERWMIITNNIDLSIYRLTPVHAE